VFNAATHFVDRHVAEGRGDHVAIEYGDQQITYREVLERVNRVGSALQHDLGVRPGERVIVLTLDCPEFVYSFFGAIKIGAIPIPVNTLWKSADYAYVLADAGASAAIVGDTLLPSLLAIPRGTLPALRHVVVVGEGASPAHGLHRFTDLLASGSAVLEAEGTREDTPAFWLYSSGSTGLPKGCIHLHRHMMVCADRYARAILGITATDRCLSVAKLFFAYGLGNALYFPFSVGATAILSPDPPAAAKVFELIERHRPTLFFSVPTNYAMLLAHHRDGAEFDLSSVRCAVSAGEALPAALFQRFQERFGIQILDGIGSTEVLHIFISNREGAIRPGSSGQVVPGYEARLLDDGGEPVPAGEIGNLLIRGDSICSGYWNQPERTREVLDGCWIRTGDKYRQDEDGFYWYAGRSDDMLKVGGIWVSPVEVESALLEHHAVLECAVVGRFDQDGLVKPAAYVVAASSAAPSADLGRELVEFVRGRLADYKRPRWIEFAADLPKTATGKIQRFKLRQRAAAARR
jgi:benzoate-CoA ligase